MVFPVIMYECENWTMKKAERRRIDAFELRHWRKFLGVPWRLQEIKPINPKSKLHWIFIGRTDGEAPIFPLDVKSQLTGKDPDAGKDWKQEEKGTTEDKMFGWYHQLNGHEFDQALGGGKGLGNLACCSPWSCRVGHDWATEQQPTKTD